MNVRPPPYNPYMYNAQQTSNLATAPPIDGYNQTNLVYLQNGQYQQNIETIPNYMYNQQIYPTYPTCPPQIYTPPQTHYNYSNTTEQYNREEIQRQRRREDECCCFGILAALCCCFVNIEL